VDQYYWCSHVIFPSFHHIMQPHYPVWLRTLSFLYSHVILGLEVISGVSLMGSSCLWGRIGFVFMWFLCNC
jgi:hypothetical protein